MTELRLWIKKSANGKYIVNKLIREGSIMAKAEYEPYTFENMKEMSEWLEKSL